MFIIPVTRMEGVGDLTDLKKDSTVKAVPEKRFDSVLKEAVREADQAIKDTQIMDMKLASGQVDNLHTALIQADVYKRQTYPRQRRRPLPTARRRW